MTYNDLVQLYFERSNALQNYWTLYVVIVENFDAIWTATAQRHATLALIRQADPAAAPGIAPVRQQLEPTLTPAGGSSTQRTHLAGDVLSLLAIWAMELGRHRRRAPRGPAAPT